MNIARWRVRLRQFNEPVEECTEKLNTLLERYIWCKLALLLVMEIGVAWFLVWMISQKNAVTYTLILQVLIGGTVYYWLFAFLMIYLHKHPTEPETETVEPGDSTETEPDTEHSILRLFVFSVFNVIDFIESIPYHIAYIWYCVTLPFSLLWIHTKYHCITLWTEAKYRYLTWNRANRNETPSRNGTSRKHV